MTHIIKIQYRGDVTKLPPFKVRDKVQDLAKVCPELFLFGLGFFCESSGHIYKSSGQLPAIKNKVQESKKFRKTHEKVQENSGKSSGFFAAGAKILGIFRLL